MNKHVAMMILLFVGLFTLGACEGNEESLEAEIETLEATIASLEGELSQKSETIDTLETELDALKDDLYDGVLTLSLETPEGIKSETVYFESDESNAYELLDSTFSVDASETDTGVFLHRIESLRELPGGFISILKNDEPADSGIKDIEFEDGDHLHFTLEFFDETGALLYDGLSEYENVADSLNASRDTFFTALHSKQLDVIDYELDDSPQNDGELLNAIFMGRAVGEDTQAFEEALADDLEVDHLYPASLNVLALSDETLDLESFHESFLDEVDVDTINDYSMDTAALTYFALIKLGETSDAQAIASELEEAEQFPDYNNAPAYAHRLMVLAHNDTIETDDVAQLLNFQTHEGGFSYMLEDDADLMFSTPQAYLALAYAQHVMDGFEGHPYAAPSNEVSE